MPEPSSEQQKSVKCPECGAPIDAVDVALNLRKANGKGPLCGDCYYSLPKLFAVEIPEEDDGLDNNLDY